MRLAKRTSTGIILSLLLVLIMSACGGAGEEVANGKLKIVAAENFYGNIAEQIGGEHVEVTSVLSDATVDPHEFEPDSATARKVSDSTFVIMNGGGFDEWMERLLETAENPDRVVLNAFELAPTKVGAEEGEEHAEEEEEHGHDHGHVNEHVWYGLDNMKVLAQEIAKNLKEKDSANAAAYDSNLQKFEQELDKAQQKIDDIKQKYAGTKVGLTEPIFHYQTEPMGLDVITPEEFQEAIAEDNDPPANTITTVNQQIANKEIKVLIYNSQVSTPITKSLEDAAKAKDIPVVAITETMPAGKTYQQWMLDQLTSLQSALGG